MAKKIKPISTYEKTRRIWLCFSLVIEVASFIGRHKEHVQIKKLNRIPKAPYLLLSTHASFMDFYVSIRATLPNHPYWVSTVEEYIDKDLIFRNLGIIPKRKFTNDPRSAEMFMDVLQDRKKILIIYPEARYSFIGRKERLDEGLGKLAKMCDVPIVVMKCHGHYLRDPQWGDHKVRKVDHLVSEMKTIVSKKQIRQMTPEDINEVINEAFEYDDEAYQLDNNIKITYQNRAVGLHQILYQCPHCGKEHMSSSGDKIKCEECGATYRLNEDGTLSCLNQETKFVKVSDWYYWEKENVKKEVESGKYHFEDDVIVEHLKGVGVGFVPLEGKYHLRSDYDGITITGDNGFRYERSALQSYAIHIEYNYKNKGQCIDLCTNTETYFVYPKTKLNSITKLHFAVECLYDWTKAKKK